MPGCGDYEKLIDPDCRDKDLLALIRYIAEEDRAERFWKIRRSLRCRSSVMENRQP